MRWSVCGWSLIMEPGIPAPPCGGNRGKMAAREGPIRAASPS